MALQNHSTDVVGSFREANYGGWFEYSDNDEVILSPLAHGGRNTRFPHKLWVDDGYRYAKVMRTVVHVIVDETDSGWVVEKWNIKNRRVRADYGLGKLNPSND